MVIQGDHFYRQVMEQARDSIFVMTLDGQILETNLAAQRAYGYSPSAFQRMRVGQLRPLTEQNLLSAQLTAASQNGILFRTWHVKKDGTHFPVEVHSGRLDMQGTPLIVSVVRDMTDAVLAELERDQREAALQALNLEVTATYEELTATHEELLATHEKLTASEEELRSQFEELMLRDKEIRRQNDLLLALQQTSLGLMQELEVDSLLEDILHRATKLVGTEHGFVYQLDAQKDVFRRTFAVGYYKQDLGREIPSGQGVVGVVYRTGKAAIVNDYKAFSRSSPASVQHEAIQAVLQIPLYLDGKLAGTIGLAYLVAGRVFTDAEVDVLEQFATIASVALEHARLLASYQWEIREKEAAVQALRQAQADNQAMINALPDQLFILDRNGRFLDYRSREQELYVAPAQFIGKTLRDIFPPALADKAMQCIAAIQSPLDLQRLEYELPIVGETGYYEARFVACGPENIMAMVRNSTERFVLQQQLEHLSLHDGLTGIYNRAFFEEQMQRFDLLRHVRVGLLICDVDGLKMMNDSLGHDAGDKMLQTVAAVLCHVFRSGDIVARIGGDEFAVLLHVDEEVSLQQYSERIRQRIDLHNEAQPALPISLSVGFAVKRDGADMRSVFKEADNHMYREKLHQQSSARSAIVRALMKALEARDFVTEGHVDRLKDAMAGFAVNLGLPENEIADICLLAQFHDIGKVGIPDHILFKPGPLNDEEWAVMRQHCEIGYRIARSAPDLAPIADWILKHQEWWNGQGYPLGLAGETVPLPCRMLAIADAFDAMTSDRPYRSAMKVSQALAEIERCAGGQFDPRLAQLFVAMHREKA